MRWSTLVARLRTFGHSLTAIMRRPSKAAREAAEYESARREFHQRREGLEAKFFKLASESGKPRGLRWMEIDFDNDVTYARNRANGELCAFVSVTIAFEAVEGGLMEGVEAVGNLRAATSVFRFDGKRWHTDGRALFNVSPAEAIQRYANDLIMVAHEPALRSG